MKMIQCIVLLNYKEVSPNKDQNEVTEGYEGERMVGTTKQPEQGIIPD